MAVLRSYRLGSLTLLIGFVLACSLGFFFVWVLAPVALIGIFYIVYLAVEERRTHRARLQLRRELLSREAAARRRAGR